MQKLKTALKSYGELAYSRPILFNVINGAFLYGIGDFIQQKVDFNKVVLGKDSRNTGLDHYNYYQTFKMITFSTISSPLNHFFYTKWLPKIAPMSDKPAMGEMLWKITADYAIASSVLNFIFPVTMGTMDGLSSDDTLDKLKKDWPVYMAADAVFWPFFQFLNFKFVPLHYQTTSIYAACLFWSIVMSAIESRTTDIQQGVVEDKKNSQ